jgi:hypothetical protein
MQLASKKYRHLFLLLFLPLQEKARKVIKILSTQWVKTATNPPLTMLTHANIQKEPKSLKNHRVASVTVAVSTTSQTSR